MYVGGGGHMLHYVCSSPPLAHAVTHVCQLPAADGFVDSHILQAEAELRDGGTQQHAQHKLAGRVLTKMTTHMHD